jgi:hypothetical protein
MTVPMKAPTAVAPAGDIMESVLLKGDIAKLSPDERVRYYGEVCRSMGLNPLTKPFEFITLNGKLQLYALRSCTDQLRKLNTVSLEIVSKDVVDDILTVHVRARTPDGRSDEDLGAVAFPSTLKGEARANAELKAVTKAKRRATLSICGLGWLDETEVEDIPAAAKRPARPAPNVMLPPHNPETGEIIEASQGPAETDSAAPAPDEPQQDAGAAESYVAKWQMMIDSATNAAQLTKAWADDKPNRDKIQFDEATATALKKKISDAIEFLKRGS